MQLHRSYLAGPGTRSYLMSTGSGMTISVVLYWMRFGHVSSFNNIMIKIMNNLINNYIASKWNWRAACFFSLASIEQKTTHVNKLINKDKFI